jgi:hypothetical protein
MSGERPTRSLIIVAHRILIGAAILFGVFFTAWQAVHYRRDGRLDHVVVAAVTAAVTLGLGYYLKNLRRFVDPGAESRAEAEDR